MKSLKKDIMVANLRKREAEYLKSRREQGKCCAVLYHGPGHQSKAYCQKIGRHKIHETTYGRYDEHATWKCMKKFTGFFDEPPQM